MKWKRSRFEEKYEALISDGERQKRIAIAKLAKLYARYHIYAKHVPNLFEDRTEIIVEQKPPRLIYRDVSVIENYRKS